MMNFTVKTSDLIRAVKIASSVVNAKHTIAILQNIRIDVGNGLKVTGIELCDNQISVEVACGTMQAGAILVNPKTLLDALSCSANEFITLTEQDNYWLAIDMQQRLPGASVEDFVSLMPEQPAIQSVPADFLDAVKRVASVMSKDDIRPNLCGLHFHQTSEFLTLSATDGHRLTTHKTRIDTAQNDYNVIIPSLTINALIKAKLSAVKVGQNGDYFTLKGEGVTFTCRHVCGVFPNIQQVMPVGLPEGVKLTPKSFLTNVKKCSKFAYNNLIRIIANEAGLELYATSPKKGEILLVEKTAFKGAPMRFGTNFKYLVDMVGAMKGVDQITMQSAGDKYSPILFTSDDLPGLACIVMPMNL